MSVLKSPYVEKPDTGSPDAFATNVAARISNTNFICKIL